MNRKARPRLAMTIRRTTPMRSSIKTSMTTMSTKIKAEAAVVDRIRTN